MDPLFFTTEKEETVFSVTKYCRAHTLDPDVAARLAGDEESRLTRTFARAFPLKSRGKSYCEHFFMATFLSLDEYLSKVYGRRQKTLSSVGADAVVSSFLA